MTLAFFDFYPIITRSSTFGDVLDQASFYFLFQRSNLVVLLGFFILAFTPLSKVFRRKYLIYSVLVALIIMFSLAFIEHRFMSIRLSDLFMKVAYNFVVICLALGMLFFIPYWTRRFKTSSIRVAKLRALSSYHQIVFLALVFVSSCAYGHVSYIPIILLTIIYGFYLSSNSQNFIPQKIEYRKSDGKALIIFGLIGIAFSFVKVSSVVCNMPWLHNYFTCP